MDQQPKDKGQGWLAFLKIWSVTLYLPLRRGMGRDHLGFSLLFGYFWIFFVAQYARAPGLMWLFVIDLAFWLIERIGQLRRRWRGVREHTEWGGASWLLEWLFGEEGAKQYGEPLVCFFVGWLIYTFTSEPNAATYFWYGGCALAAFNASGAMRRRKIEDQMNNAMIEQRWNMSRMRRRF